MLAMHLDITRAHGSCAPSCAPSVTQHAASIPSAADPGHQALSLTTPTGRYWPVRTYNHGTVAALASSHSDLPLLLRLLLEQGLKPLKQATEGRYYRLR